ncbi:MAG: DUF429 domain-containing protein [Planctomycetes bacterium]|nr:DUF429 domain-containing protein [Planctomycetota bacterium]
MPTFLGIDLAWKSKNPSGVCVLQERSGEFTCTDLRAVPLGVDALVELALGYGDDVVVAIDAPLIISDQRRAEREVGRLFSSYHASAYPADRALLEPAGLLAGPDLGKALGHRGFSLDPRVLQPGGGGRHAFEVYPHTLHVVWFDLCERIPYKAKRGRSPSDLVDCLQHYQRCLGKVLRCWMPELLEASQELRGLLDPGAAECRGRERKDLEDRLDAVTCALAAYRAWRDGVDDCEILGDTQDGYIAVPGLKDDPRFAAALSR